MINEYDRVKTKVKKIACLNSVETPIPAGTIGTVIFLYREDYFELEFLLDGGVYSLGTYRIDEIEKV